MGRGWTWAVESQLSASIGPEPSIDRLDGPSGVDRGPPRGGGWHGPHVHAQCYMQWGGRRRRDISTARSSHSKLWRHQHSALITQQTITAAQCSARPTRTSPRCCTSQLLGTATKQHTARVCVQRDPRQHDPQPAQPTHSWAHALLGQSSGRPMLGSVGAQLGP